MGKSKKTEDNKVKQVEVKSSEVEARPQHQGKDPLAEGNTLVNPTNTEAETHYEVKERSEDVQKASEIAGQNANERAEVHNGQVAQPHDVPNSDVAEQDEVAAGRVEPGEEL